MRKTWEVAEELRKLLKNKGINAKVIAHHPAKNGHKGHLIIHFYNLDPRYKVGVNNLLAKFNDEVTMHTIEYT